MKYIYAAAIAFAGIAAADVISYPTPTVISFSFADLSQYSSAADQFADDWHDFQTSVTAQPDFTAFLSAWSSAAGASEFSKITDPELNENDIFSAMTDTAIPTWWSKLPTSAQAYATSVLAEVASIESQAFLGAAAETPAPIMKAAAVAGAGALAGAALLL